MDATEVIEEVMAEVEAEVSDKLMDAYDTVIRLARHRDLTETEQLFELLQQFKSTKKCVLKQLLTEQGIETRHTGEHDASRFHSP